MQTFAPSRCTQTAALIFNASSAYLRKQKPRVFDPSGQFANSNRFASANTREIFTAEEEREKFLWLIMSGDLWRKLIFFHTRASSHRVLVEMITVIYATREWNVTSLIKFCRTDLVNFLKVTMKVNFEWPVAQQKPWDYYLSFFPVSGWLLNLFIFNKNCKKYSVK